MRAERGGVATVTITNNCSCCTSNHAVSGRQPTSPDTGTAGRPLESSLVAWYARLAIVCTAALSWRSVRGRCRFGRARGRRQLALETHRTLISAGNRLQACWGRGQAAAERLVLHTAVLPSAHLPSSTAPPRHRTELQIAGRERPPRTRPNEFLKKLDGTTRAMAARTRRSRHFCAATQCASAKLSLHLSADYSTAVQPRMPTQLAN
jgi:hypothetical protein